MGLFSVSIRGKVRGGNESWVTAGVYGLTDGGLLDRFLKELGNVRNKWDGAWCIGGDCYEVLMSEERNRGGRQTRGMGIFFGIH